MSNQNPYENYPQNPNWQNNQPSYEGQIPPTEPAPGYPPQSYPPPTQYASPEAYPPPPTQYDQPAAYPPPPTQYDSPGAYPPPQYQQQGYMPQGAYAPQGYAAMPGAAPAERGGGFAIAGLILGIISTVAAILPICGFPISIVGIVMSALGRRSVSKRTMATIGLVLAIIGIILAALSAAYGYNYALQHFQ